MTNRRTSAFTLVELLVVLTIIALLIAILLPALGAARAASRAATCLANQRSVGQALVEYQTDDNELVVPSFNMQPGTYVADPSWPFEGWPCILNKEGYMTGNQTFLNNAFYCPDTLNFEGMQNGQTGSNPLLPQGYQDWPIAQTGADGTPETTVTIPSRGYNTVLRTSYWLNAYNPLGSEAVVSKSLYYTHSVGCLTSDGVTDLAPISFTRIVQPSSLIVATDGVYMGRQSSDRLGQANSRVAYRHPGPNGGDSNSVFADGHAEPLSEDLMPLGSTSTSGVAAYVSDYNGQTYGPYTYAQVQAMNFDKYTVFYDPRSALP